MGTLVYDDDQDLLLADLVSPGQEYVGRPGEVGEARATSTLPRPGARLPASPSPESRARSCI